MNSYHVGWDAKNNRLLADKYAAKGFLTILPGIQNLTLFSHSSRSICSYQGNKIFVEKIEKIFS